MAIGNFFNYAGISPVSMGDLTEPYRQNASFIDQRKREALERAMLGNELEYQPDRLRAEALQRELSNRGLDIGNQSAQLDLGYKPKNLQEEYLAKVLANQMQRSSITGQDIQNRYQPSLYDAQINQARQAGELSAAKAAFERNRPPPLSKSAEKVLEKNNEKLGAAYELRDSALALDEIMNNPLIKNYIGAANQYFPDSLLRNKVKQIGGDFEVLSGRIATDAISAFKGSTSDKELAFVQKQVAKRGDTFDVAKAKTESLVSAVEQLIRRNELASEYISEGFKPHQAMSEAAKQTPIITAQTRREFARLSKENEQAKKMSSDRLRASALGGGE